MCPPSSHIWQPCRVVCMLVYMFVTTVTPYACNYTTIPPPYICVCMYMRHLAQACTALLYFLSAHLSYPLLGDVLWLWLVYFETQECWVHPTV